MDGQLKLVAGRRVMFTVPGLPKGKERPRARIVTPKGKKPFATMYTPTGTKKYEAEVKAAAQKAMQHEPFQGPVSVTILIMLPMAKTMTKKRRARIEDGLEACTKKPDTSNVAKAVEDAMNDVVYKDDNQIIYSTIKKDYSDQPRVSVLVTEMVEPEPELLKPPTSTNADAAGLGKQGDDADVSVRDVGTPADETVGGASVREADADIDGELSQAATTACGAKSVQTCPNHEIKGAPWCVTCLAPGLRDKKNRPKGMIVIGEDDGEGHTSRPVRRGGLEAAPEEPAVS